MVQQTKTETFHTKCVFTKCKPHKYHMVNYNDSSEVEGVSNTCKLCSSHPVISHVSQSHTTTYKMFFFFFSFKLNNNVFLNLFVSHLHCEFHFYLLLLFPGL
jgi:hypothetical protein